MGLRSPPGGRMVARISLAAAAIYDASGRMLVARGPFVDGSSSNATRCPSLSCSKALSFTALRWKNHSCPPSSRMKPNPLSRTSRLIVPLGIRSSSGRTPALGACTDGNPARLPRDHPQETPEVAAGAPAVVSVGVSTTIAQAAVPVNWKGDLTASSAEPPDDRRVMDDDDLLRAV